MVSPSPEDTVLFHQHHIWYGQPLFSQNPLPSNLWVIHGDEYWSPRPDLQPELSKEWAHLQPAGPTVDLHLWLCCKCDCIKIVCAILKHLLCISVCSNSWRDKYSLRLVYLSPLYRYETTLEPTPWSWSPVQQPRIWNTQFHQSVVPENQSPLNSTSDSSK